jgi:GT2 family glycosyltransferase
MKLSFSVLTFNSSNVLSQCIDTILLKLINYNIEYELNILNNGSTDDTKKVILSKSGNINYYENEVNKSFTNGFNFLLSRACGDIYCMMSDDVILEDDIIQYIINFYSSNVNNHVVLAPKSILPNGNLDRINKKELSEIDLLFGYTILGNFIKRTNADLNQTKSCTAEVIQDSCLFFTEKIKTDFVFDEDYKFYFTEDSLSIGLREKGFALRYDVEISVKHFLKQATKKVKNTKINTIYMKDCITYSRKNTNLIFHFFIFCPLMLLTYAVRYIKWVFNKNDYH